MAWRAQDSTAAGCRQRACACLGMAPGSTGAWSTVTAPCSHCHSSDVTREGSVPVLSPMGCFLPGCWGGGGVCEQRDRDSTGQTPGIKRKKHFLGCSFPVKMGLLLSSQCSSQTPAPPCCPLCTKATQLLAPTTSHDVSLFQEEFQLLEDTSQLLNVLQGNKLGQSSFKFPPRGIQRKL